MTSDLSVVRTVPVAAAIVRATRPHVPPPRHCKTCGAKAAAGCMWCADCRDGR